MGVTMAKISGAYMAEFVAAAHRVAEYGLVIGGSGNLSWRVNNGLMLLTTTGSWMAGLSRSQVAVCRIKDELSLNGKKPSKEIGFHAGVLRERADVNVVLHFQSPCATVLACRKPQVTNFSVIPEMPYYIGPVATVPYLSPGTNELAEAVTSAMQRHDLAILRNHGQVVVDADIDQAIAKAAYFELACRIILQAQGQVQFLSADAIADQRRKGIASRAGR